MNSWSNYMNYRINLNKLNRLTKFQLKLAFIKLENNFQYYHQCDVIKTQFIIYKN